MKHWKETANFLKRWTLTRTQTRTIFWLGIRFNSTRPDLFFFFLFKFSLEFLHLLIGVCRKPTDPSNLIQPNSTRRVGSVFKVWQVGLDYKKNFYSGSGWVWVIKLQTRQTRPTHPYLIYI